MPVGITAHAQDLLGDMVYVELPEIGREVVLGEEIGVLESVKAAADLYAPLSGRIVALNEAVVANPSLLNSDPAGEGWLIKIRPLEPKKFVEERNSLLSEAEYLGAISEEI
jgi:glycine cleavage system H protein